MVFSSPRFLLFLVVLLALLGVLRGTGVKKRALTVASCLFYAVWDYRYLGLLLFISVVDFVAAQRMSVTESRVRRKAWLLVSLVSNLGLLAFFKYWGFLADNANSLLAGLGLAVPRLDILLPAGISFYTFKTMSYTIDVYRDELQPCSSWLDYAMFVTFFPELIAGPIVRASVFLPQMSRPIGPTRERLAVGSSLFLLGLTKKVFIADRLAAVADPIFASPHLYSTGSIWCGVLAYTLQIYCDFSGYSDMAIGTAKMVGYDLPENFNMPYLATNIAEFWRRWHMTLSAWLKDYLYVPLGGNRGSSWNTARNLMITMLLGGLWHGASWNFVLWGGLHGAALGAHRAWKRLGMSGRLPPPLAWVMTVGFVVVTWIPFRAVSWDKTVAIGGRLLPDSLGGALWYPSWLAISLVLAVIGHVLGRVLLAQPDVGVGKDLLSALGARVERSSVSGPVVRLSLDTVIGAYCVALWVLVLFLFAPTRTSPFIYFQF